jgi:hypothetical protein
LGDILDKNEDLKKAIEEFSRVRAKDSKALVTLCRAGDRPGRIGFLSYLIPIIMDGFFSKVAPAIFEPPMPALLHNDQYSFHQAAVRKRLDRLVQVSMISASVVLLVRSTKQLVRAIARVLGKSNSTVALGLIIPFIAFFLMRNYAIPAMMQRTKSST